MLHRSKALDEQLINELKVESTEGEKGVFDSQLNVQGRRE